MRINLWFLPAAIGAGLFSAGAQPNGGAPWSELRSKNPPGIEISLRLFESRPYREGELIRAGIRFPGPGHPLGQPPPLELWQFGGFLLDPVAECGSLAATCFQSMNMGFDKSDPALRLGDTPDPVTVSLNNDLPHLPPGSYRAAVVARKLVLTRREPGSTTYLYPAPQEYAVSNAVEFEVVSAPEAWVRGAIADSVAILAGPQPNGAVAYEQHRVAAQQLRFLDVPAAWSASLAMLPEGEDILLTGLAATREPARVCGMMQAAVAAPLQAVSSYYVRAMAEVCARANRPPAPPYVPPPPGRTPPEPTAEQQVYWREHREYREGLTGRALDNLAASLAQKRGDRKAIAFQTLIERVQSLRANEPRQPLPAWLPAVKAEFVKSYAGIEGWRQRALLSQFASTLRSPDMVPLLEGVLDGWKPGDYEAVREAIQNLYAIDPARAQARIVAELPKARTWLDTPQLALLPAGDARIADDALIGALDAAQRAGGWNVELRMTALAKYATPKALPRIKAIYESQQDRCQPELMAYFVRVDPAYADQMFHSHPWDMHAAPPACTERYFERAPRIAMAPVLERYMTAYLMHSMVAVKMTAAKSLGRFGSAGAAGPLWDAFRYFHEYWNGKQGELVQNGEGVFLEVELRNAIARGRHWLATATDLRTIEFLCVSDRCLSETRQDLSAWQEPLRIWIGDDPGGIRGTIAQYNGLESVEALEEKLGQFPKGTRFVLTANGDGASEAAARIRQYASAHGLTIASQ